MLTMERLEDRTLLAALTDVVDVGPFAHINGTEHDSAIVLEPSGRLVVVDRPAYATSFEDLAGDGSDVAYRARCRPPSYIHFALFPHLIKGHTLSDVVAVLGSLNVIAAELDR